jgi:hypothetical protein
VPLAVIARHSTALAADVHTLRRRGAIERDVVLAGGVVSHQPRLAQAITSRLATTDPDLSVTVLFDPPVHGALALARSLHTK